MRKTHWIRLIAFPLTLTTMALSGCIFEWREDDRDSRRGFHDRMVDDCPSDQVWDPVACECVPRDTFDDAPDAGPGDPPPDSGVPSDIPDAGTSTTTCPDPMTSLYLSEDFVSCGTIEFNCPTEYESFSIADCGCGCFMDGPPDACPADDAEGLIVVSRETKVCETVMFNCPEGTQKYFADCGCGCVAAAQGPQCPDPNDPMVHYLGDDPSVCDLITFTCPDTCTPFNNDCGCGCIENP